MAFNFNFKLAFSVSLTSPILDQLSVAPAGAYSLRKLRSAYTGSAIRVRRSLDNAEADIGFDGTDLDTTALINHVGYENLLGFSEEFNNAAWDGLANSGETIAINSEVAPNGTTTADRCTVTSAGSGRFQNITLPSAGQVTVSTYIKIGTSGTWARLGVYDTAAPNNQARCWVNMATGVLGIVAIIGTGWSDITATSTDAGNGYYRVSVTATCTATQISALIVNASNDGSTIRTIGHNRILWGAQLNQGALQPYQQTVATANQGNGFVTTWYDQSGNARNVTQATAGSQPSIVTSGVVNMANGKPAIKMDGVNDVLSSVGFINSVLLNSPMMFNYVHDGANTRFGWSGNGINGSGDLPRLYLLPTSLSYGALNVPAVTPILGPQILGFTHNGVNTTSVRRNGVQLATATQAVETVGFGGGGRLSVPFQAGGTFQAGLVTEGILFASALTTTDRQLLERDQGQYYGISVA